MKRSLISRRDELPRQFSIDKYAPCRDFGLVEWVVNLEVRVMVATFIGTGLQTFDARESSLQIMEKPIFSPKKFETQPGLLKHVGSRHVRDASVSDTFFRGMEFCFHNGYLRFKEAFARYDGAGGVATSDDLELVHMPAWMMDKEAGVDDDGNVNVVVDLHGSVEKTIEDFRAWLLNIREERGIKAPKRRTGQKEMESWADKGLLPYLDLRNWARAHGVEISQQVVGVALFPEEYDIALGERVRKVIAPLASEVAHESFTDALRSQAKEEMAEQNAGKSVPGKWDNVFLADGQSAIRNPDQ